MHAALQSKQQKQVTHNDYHGIALDQILCHDCNEKLWTIIENTMNGLIPLLSGSSMKYIEKHFEKYLETVIQEMKADTSKENKNRYVYMVAYKLTLENFLYEIMN